MKNITVCNILLNIIGIIAFLAAVFIWFWVGTVGLYIASYSHQMNKEIWSFFMLGIGIIIGGIVIKIGIGIFRRKRWSRKALLIFWSLVSIYIVGYILLSIQDAFTDIETWLANAPFWLLIAIIGILHVVFLNSSTVKELFNKRRLTKAL